MTKECRPAIKVLPKAGRNAIDGWENDELKVRLRAVAEKGEANRVLIAFLAEILNLPKSAVTLLRGETSRHKLLLIRGLDRPELEQRFEDRGK